MSDQPKPGMQNVRIGVVLDVEGNWFTSGHQYKGKNGVTGAYTELELIRLATENSQLDGRKKHLCRFFIIDVELPYKPQTIQLGEISNPAPVPTYNIKDFSLPGELDEK